MTLNQRRINVDVTLSQRCMPAVGTRRLYLNGDTSMKKDDDDKAFYGQ